jgi:hypothetical protein
MCPAWAWFPARLSISPHPGRSTFVHTLICVQTLTCDELARNDPVLNDPVLNNLGPEARPERGDRLHRDEQSGPNRSEPGAGRIATHVTRRNRVRFPKIRIGGRLDQEA